MSEKLVTVAIFEDYIKADLARQLLEDEGIKAFVMGQNVGTAWGGPPASKIELQTPESQAQRAGEILEAHRQESQEFAEEDEALEPDEDFEDDLDLQEEQE
jgi:hypothetical protein